MGSIFQEEFGIEEVRGVIDSFAVREKFRHQGVASALLDWLLDWLREAGATRIETLCRWNDKGVAALLRVRGLPPLFEHRPDVALSVAFVDKAPGYSGSPSARSCTARRSRDE